MRKKRENKIPCSRLLEPQRAYCRDLPFTTLLEAKIVPISPGTIYGSGSQKLPLYF